MTVNRIVPATTSDDDVMTGLDELREELAEVGGDMSRAWSSITGLPDDGGYRLAVSDDVPPWA